MVFTGSGFITGVSSVNAGTGITVVGLAKISKGSLPAKISAILSDTASIAAQVARSLLVSPLPGKSTGLAFALPSVTTALGRWKSLSMTDRLTKLSGLRDVMSPMPRMVITNSKNSQQ